MEGVAFSQFDCLSLMAELGITSNKVILFGGGSKSNLWCHIVSDIFNTNIATLNVEEGPSYGGAILAGVGYGLYPTVEEATSRIIKEVSSTTPESENVSKYNKVYKVYNSLYKSLKGDFKELSVL